MDLRKFIDKDLQKEAQLRSKALAKELNVSLNLITSGDVAQAWKDRNVENVIGTIQVPLGVAGPVEYEFMGKKIEQYLPLATTEGALVASLSRGCKVIRESDSGFVYVEDRGMSRAPVFELPSLKEAVSFSKNVKSEFSSLKAITEENSNHLSLKEIDSFVLGRHVYVRFVYATSEAMGMNMVTLATQKAVPWIENTFGVKCVALSGNWCVDKKEASVNWVSGRGKRVWCEVHIPEELVTAVLKTNVRDLFDVYQAKTVKGTQVAGSNGFNAHAVNAIAALYLATGQDVAHVVHGGNSVFSLEVTSGGILASCYLPNVLVGTVGGGTNGPTQKEALSILGIEGTQSQDSERLAAAVGIAVLAGEVSLHGALASQSLAEAHGSLGRGTQND